MTSDTRAREHYGIDAPTVVRNLGVGGIALIVLGVIAPHIAAAIAPLAPVLLGTGVGMAAGAVWMLASSLWFKKIVMRRLLAERSWRGDEIALDVGSGRGLIAIAAARRAPAGKVHALDIWQEQDLSGNSPAALLSNGRAAGVAARLVIDTGDARQMPYPDATFDVVVSMTALHNIPDAAGRATAVAEIWRVTRPGGQILIFDIRHARRYAAQLRALGAIEIKLRGPILLWGLVGWRFTATKPA